MGGKIALKKKYQIITHDNALIESVKDVFVVEIQTVL